MNKGLEALEKIKNNLRLFGFDEDTDNFKLLNIIEKELKRLEELDNGAYVSVHINRYNELCDKEDAFDALSKDDEKAKKLLSKEIEKNRVLEFIKKCFYVAKSSGAILRTDYGFEHEKELKELLL